MERSLASRVELVPLVEQDVPLVSGWIQAAHVRRWWITQGGALSALRDPSRRSGQHVILADGQPVGYLAAETMDPFSWAAIVLDVSKGAIDLHILIGAEEHCGQGIGSAAIGKLIDEIETQTYLATTSISNIASRRAFNKNGFVEAGQFEEFGAGRMVLVVRRPK